GVRVMISSPAVPPRSHSTPPLPSPPPQGGREQTEFAARFNSYIGIRPVRSEIPTGARNPARQTSRPGVAAAVEEAVFVVVRGGLAVRLDGADLGERGLHRGALVDGVEPAREIGIVLPLHALGIMVARPWEGRHVGDGVILAAEIGRLAEPRLQHLVEALYFRRVAGERIV